MPAPCITLRRSPTGGKEQRWALEGVSSSLSIRFCAAYRAPPPANALERRRRPTAQPHWRGRVPRGPRSPIRSGLDRCERGVCNRVDRTVRAIRRTAVTRQVDADDLKAFAQRRNKRSRRSSANAQSVEKEDRALVIDHGVTIPPFTFNVSPET